MNNEPAATPPTQPDNTIDSELPNWVCLPDDDDSHLTTYTHDGITGGCPIHEIASGCSLPQQELTNLIAQEANKARVNELKMLQDLYKNELKFTHRDESELRSYTQHRIAKLTSEKGSNE